MDRSNQSSKDALTRFLILRNSWPTNKKRRMCTHGRVTATRAFWARYASDGRFIYIAVRGGRDIVPTPAALDTIRDDIV